MWEPLKQTELPKIFCYDKNTMPNVTKHNVHKYKLLGPCCITIIIACKCVIIAASEWRHQVTKLKV